jgi:hypothetical protein
MRTETANGIETVWCEQCGESPATVIAKHAVLCDECFKAEPFGDLRQSVIDSIAKLLSEMPAGSERASAERIYDMIFMPLTPSIKGIYSAS